MKLAPERDHLVFALALAVAAYYQTHERFRELERRLEAEGPEAALTFELESPESLFLEIELTLQGDGVDPANVEILVNESELARLRVEQRYLVQRRKLFVSREAVRAGRNDLAVRTSAPSSTFDLKTRIHNYYGINPKFPRAFVVSDEAARSFFSSWSPEGRALRFLVFYVASLLLVRGGSLFFQGARTLPMALPSVLPWCALLYGALTPLHVFLSPEALLVVSVGPLAVLGGFSRVRGRRYQVARAAGVALLTLAVLEVAFRLYHRVSPSFIFYSDSYDRYRGQPFAPHFDSQLNSRGFLDEEPRVEKESGRFRIVAIGDSFALGVVPYESNYLTLLEDALSPRGVEVINMGIPATDPDDYLALLVNEGLALSPDLVLVGFFIGNDFELRHPRPHEYSFVATFFRYLWTLAVSGRRIEHPGGTSARYDDEQPTLERNRFLAIETDRSRIFRPDGSLEMALPRAVGALRRMRDLTRRAGSDFLVVILPDELQVDRALQKEIASAYGTTPDGFDFELPNRILARRLSEEGIAFLDLLPAFVEEGRSTRLYKPQDTHWNVAGNRLAARELAAHLAERF